MGNRPAILVTGGAGYIGSHCCRALDAAGAAGGFVGMEGILSAVEERGKSLA